VENRKQSAEGNRVAFLLSQVGARSAQEFARLLGPLKLTPADAGVLRLLRRTPGLSQQRLAEVLDMHASRLVGLIDSLEERGLVVREPNLQDRRVYSLRLTEAGNAMLHAIGQVARAHNELMCSGLSQSECAELTSLLQRIAAEHGLVSGVHPGYKELRGADAREE
jgi:DNA-binding MarR family transcriptional regulator